jgi:hypothetical protein
MSIGNWRDVIGVVADLRDDRIAEKAPSLLSHHGLILSACVEPSKQNRVKMYVGETTGLVTKAFAYLLISRSKLRFLPRPPLKSIIYSY